MKTRQLTVIGTLILVGLIELTFAADSYTFEIDGYDIITNTPNISTIDMDWDSKHLSIFSINFTEPYTGQFEIQIPKNMPRMVNLDFETTLMMDVSYLSGAEQEKDWDEHITEMDFKMIDDRISETESMCHYVITVELSNSDYFKIVTGSVASGRWETVAIQNEECDEVYDQGPEHGTMLSHNVNQISKSLSPLKQFHSGIPHDEIRCHEDLELVQKHDGSPACVKPETKRILIERGWTQESSASNNYVLRYSPVVFKGTGMEITGGQLSFEDLQKLEQRKLELDMLLDDKTITEEMNDERKMIQHYAQLAFDKKVPWDLVKILWEKKKIVTGKVDDIDRDRFPIVSLSGISIGFDAYSVEEQYAGNPTAIKIGILKEKFTKETLERTDRMLRESVGDEIDIIYYKSAYIASYSR